MKLLFSLLVAICFIFLFYFFKSETTTDFSNVPKAKSPYNVKKIQIDMPLNKCLEILGEPNKKSDSIGDRTLYQWQYPSEISLTFDKEARVCEILSKELSDSSGRNFIYPGVGEEELKKSLEKFKSTKMKSPVGDVISIRRVHYATIYEFEDINAKYEVSFDASGLLNYVLVRRR